MRRALGHTQACAAGTTNSGRYQHRLRQPKILTQQETKNSGGRSRDYRKKMATGTTINWFHRWLALRQTEASAGRTNTDRYHRRSRKLALAKCQQVWRLWQVQQVPPQTQALWPMRLALRQTQTGGSFTTPTNSGRCHKYHQKTQVSRYHHRLALGQTQTGGSLTTTDTPQVPQTEAGAAGTTKTGAAGN